MSSLSRSENLLVAMFLRTSVLHSLGRLTVVQFPWLRPTVILINASAKHRPVYIFPWIYPAKNSKSTNPIQLFQDPIFSPYIQPQPQILSLKRNPRFLNSIFSHWSLILSHTLRNVVLTGRTTMFVSRNSLFWKPFSLLFHVW